ncbi:MAG TPA: hypothetical protein VIU42_06585, partial [Xanthobacteraceae bacterium]
AGGASGDCSNGLRSKVSLKMLPRSSQCSLRNIMLDGLAVFSARRASLWNSPDFNDSQHRYRMAIDIGPDKDNLRLWGG